MHRPEYPEWGRREAMLWAIHDWVQDRTAGENNLSYDQVATLVGGGEYVGPWEEDPDKQATKKFHAEQLNLFIGLVNEGLIDADVRPMDGPVPFSRATVLGLSDRGLQLIQELPDPQRTLVQTLDQMAEAIGNLGSVPEDQKNAATKAAEELKTFARNATPAVAAQLLAAWLRLPSG